MAQQVIMQQPQAHSHDPEASINVSNFRWHAADKKLQAKSVVAPSTAPAPPLGVLEAFNGNFSGNGMNFIFRPNSGPPNGTTFPNPVTPAPPTPPSENVLQINLTAETLNFGAALGSVPNRGLEGRQDIFLNGVPYVQTINDVANPVTGKADGVPVGIHFEPGVWMHLPATTADPPLPASLNRMGSIPHGTTINAQCLEPTQTFKDPPKIPTVDITPFVIDGFQLRDTSHSQDLSKFIATGTITQAILDDPNTVLRNANVGKDIIKTEVFTVDTAPPAPEFGGGTANIAFLTGAGTAGPNANAARMTATFWINTVQSTIHLPVLRPGHPPLRITPAEPHPGARVPTFIVQSHPGEQTEARTITVQHKEIQYSQVVQLTFAGLTWPHVSVATLVPTTEQKVPIAITPLRPVEGKPVPATVVVQAPIKEKVIIELEHGNGVDGEKTDGH